MEIDTTSRSARPQPKTPSSFLVGSAFFVRLCGSVFACDERQTKLRRLSKRNPQGAYAVLLGGEERFHRPEDGRRWELIFRDLGEKDVS